MIFIQIGRHESFNQYRTLKVDILLRDTYSHIIIKAIISNILTSLRFIGFPYFTPLIYTVCMWHTFSFRRPSCPVMRTAMHCLIVNK